MYIGRWSDGNRYCDGSVDQVRVFNKVISDAEALTLYQEGSDYFGDSSDNGNHFNAFRIQADDVVPDSPTNNFATLNPLNSSTNIGLNEGNLSFNNTSGDAGATGTFTISSGKWYWEVLLDTDFGEQGIIIDPANYTLANDSSIDATGHNQIAYISNSGSLRDQGSTGGWSTGSTVGHIISIAVDADAEKIWFADNGVWKESGDPENGTNPAASAWTGSSKDITPYILMAAAAGAPQTHNFGQDSSFAGNKSAQGHSDSNGIGDFYYEPPTDFLALCTDNFPEPTVVPSEHFAVLTYTGNGSTQSITGAGFQPDLVWLKQRSGTNWHELYDINRGTSKPLYSNSTIAEDSDSGLTSFDSDGFSVGSAYGANQSSSTYVAWCWKANGSPVSNTDGSITSQVSANVDAGFSVVSYTSPNTTVDETVGHGLSSVPELIIAKNRDNTYNWDIYHKDLASGNGLIFTTAASTANRWTTTAPTSSVFSVLWNYEHYSTNDYIAYCFHSVDGYSKVGSYTGNGSTDGTFVYTGFRPAYVMVKATSISGESWHVLDSKRDTYNVNYHRLTVNGSYSENTNDNWHDFTSNGFKIRWDNAGVNQNNVAYIFYAVAETDFKHSNAR